MAWVCLPQDRDKWRTLVVTVLKCGLHTKRETSRLFEDLSPFLTVLSSIELDSELLISCLFGLVANQAARHSASQFISNQ